MSYTLIVLSAIIGILGILVDTKPNKKPKYFLKVNRIRATIIIAILALVTVSLLHQWNQDKADKNREIEIGNILHPLFPLKVSSEFTIVLDSLSNGEKVQFNNILDDLAQVNRNDTINNLPSGLLMFKSSDGRVSFLQGITGNESGRFLIRCHDSYIYLVWFLFKYLPDRYSLMFLDNSKEYPENIDLEFSVKRNTVTYHYFAEANFIRLKWADTIKNHQVNKSNITNIEEYVKNRDSLKLEVFGSKFTSKTLFTRLIVETGDTYYHSYQVDPFDDMKKERKMINDTAPITYKDIFTYISRQ